MRLFTAVPMVKSSQKFASFVRPASRIAVLVLAAAVLAGCQETRTGAKAYRPIPSDTLAVMEKNGTTKNAPVLIRAYKKEAELEVWKMKANGEYVHIKTFPMCRWSGQLGPKRREGDRQVPEGFYTVSPGQMNPNSAYYLSFNVGYPNTLDRAMGFTGGSIMVHGACSSAGCFSMTDEQIEEIYAIAREAFSGGQRAIQMQSMPFRMNPENLAKHRLDPNMAFWRQLKEGMDRFDVTKREPQVNFCGRRYVFDGASNGQRFDVNAACPPLATDPNVDALVAQKRLADDQKVAELVNRGVTPIKLVYNDGGQHPAMAHVMEVSRPEALAEAPREISLDAQGRPLATLVAKAEAPALVMAANSPKPAVQPSKPVETASNDSGMMQKWLGFSIFGDTAKEPMATAIAEPMPLPVPRPRALLDGKPQASNMPGHFVRVAQGASPILGNTLTARN